MVNRKAPQLHKLLAKTMSLLVGLQCVGVPDRVQASGPFSIEPNFFDVPLDPQAHMAGERFTADGRSFAQVLTYLHMADAFDAGQQQLFESYLQDLARNTDDNGFNVWQEALRALGRDSSYFSTAKMVSTTLSSNGQSYTTQSYVENCLPDAFTTANATLQERINRYGRNSVQLNRWLDAQIQVFSHCGNSAFDPPAEPDPSWEAQEQHDRAYQIAAAYFYDMQYAEAARRFQLIGMDAASSWAELGRYLVGRSLIRQALVANDDREQNLAAAQSVFDTLAQDADYLQRFPSVRGQQAHVNIKRDTPAFLNRIGVQLVNDPAQLTPNELADYLFLWNNGTHAVAEDGALGHWLSLANNPSRTATESIVQAWQTYRTRPWLYLALTRTYFDHTEPAIDELVQATALLVANDPETTALFVEAAELLQETGRVGQAEALIQRLLSNQQTPLTATLRNRLDYALALSSTDWRDFPVRAQLDVNALTYDSQEYLSLTQEALAAATHHSPLFPPEATNLINAYFTPAMLLQVIEAGQLSGYLTGRVAIAGWVKALMLDDTATAQALARILYDYYPARREALGRYLQGTEPEFEAAAIMLELPGYSPFLHTGIGRERMGTESGSIEFVPDHVASGLGGQNWWCTMVYNYQDANAQDSFRQQWMSRAAVELERPVFSAFSAVQKTGLASMLPDLQQGVAAVFGPVVVEYATANPDDPRVPRLLHRVVFASRYACSGGPGNVSRAAFELLHKNYPNSEWAARTPYWFE